MRQAEGHFRSSFNPTNQTTAAVARYTRPVFVVGQYKTASRNAAAVTISKTRRATHFDFGLRPVLLDSGSVISRNSGSAIVRDGKIANRASELKCLYSPVWRTKRASLF